MVETEDVAGRGPPAIQLDYAGIEFLVEDKEPTQTF